MSNEDKHRGDDGLALVVGERGAILRSTDGGDSFAEVVSAAPAPISAISVPEASAMAGAPPPPMPQADPERNP